MGFDLTEPEMSWSLSRILIMKECTMKYYFNYYGYFGGWQKGAKPETRKIYMLKKLTPIDALFGNLFHAQVKSTLKYSHASQANNEIFRRQINKKVKECYQESINYLEAFTEAPAQYTMIQEIFYSSESDISQDKKDKIIKKINTTSANIFDNNSFQELLNDKIEILELDELKSFDFEGFKVYLKIDALFRDNASGSYVICDWKTSTSPGITEDYILQLLLYAFYVTEVYGVSIENIETRLENVFWNEIGSGVFTFSQEDIEVLKNKLRSDRKSLNNYIVPGTKNKPLPEEAFEKTSNEWVCQLCNFRLLCQ